MRVEVVRAWPRAFERIELELPAGATAADALSAAGIEPGDTPFAIFGVRAEPGTPLTEGDRIELLRPLQVDPKDARRARAAARARKPG